MNDKYDWINDIYIYYRILDKINKQFKILLKTTDHEEIEEQFFYLCVDLLRFVPFKQNKEDEKLSLIESDGICLLRKNIDFIIKDLNKILQENTATFIKIRKIRNKYEHEPHNVNGAFSTGHSSFSAMGFYCKTDLVTLNSMELTYIIYDLNKLMDKIEKMICKIQEKDFNELNIFNKDYITKIKGYKIIEYNKSYTIVPRNWFTVTRK